MPNIIPLAEKNLPKDCYVFKHSTQCPISGSAKEEVISADLPLPIYWINVIEERPMSNWVAETYGITHESPQLLLIKDGKVSQVWNHRSVRKADIEK